jgi:hypothetical protein
MITVEYCRTMLMSDMERYLDHALDLAQDFLRFTSVKNHQLAREYVINYITDKISSYSAQYVGVIDQINIKCDLTNNSEQDIKVGNLTATIIIPFYTGNIIVERTKEHYRYNEL